MRPRDRWYERLMTLMTMSVLYSAVDMPRGVHTSPTQGVQQY